MEDGDEIKGGVKRFGKVITVGLRVDFEVNIFGKVILLVATVDVSPLCNLVVVDSVRSKLNGEVVDEGVDFNVSVVVSIDWSGFDDINTVAPSVCISTLFSVDVIPVVVVGGSA